MLVVWLSHLLSHSSQEKVLYRSAIKGYEQVSDECSSGVMRARQWPSPYLVCIPCVQRLSAAQKKLSQPSLLSETRKFGLELEVKNSKRSIKKDKKSLLANEKAIKKLQDALGQLTCKYTN